MNRLANLVIAGTGSAELNQLVDVLAARKYTAKAFDDAIAFLEAARTSQPDLAIVDIARAEINGFQLAADLGDRDLTANIPVLLIGADGSPDMFDAALDVGTDDVFVTPIDHDEFLARLQPLLRLSTMHAELHRRVQLARQFGVEVEKHIDLAVDDKPYDILVVGAAPEAGRERLREVLEDHCSVSVSDDIFAAEDQLFDKFFDACVIVLDEHFGRESCLELCTNIRNNPRLFNLPVLLLARAGALDDPIEPYRRGVSRVVDEGATSEELRYALVTLVNRQRQRWSIRQAIDTTKQPAICDELTGTHTFDFMRAHLENLIEAAHKWQKHLTLVFFSIPEVVEIRARFGELAADHLLDQLAQWITGLVRVEDMTARDGKHDFCVALPDTSADVAHFVTHRIAGIIGHTDFALHKVYQPIGVAVAVTMTELEAGDTVDTLVARARRGDR
jgi:two-component system, cell cycle response regulator